MSDPGSEAGRSMGEPANAPCCQARTKRGAPCAATVLPARPWCFSHDPDQAEARHAARSKGAVAANKLRTLEGRRARLDTVPGLVRFTGRIVHDTLEGQITPDVARSVLAGLNLQRQLLEASDLEERLAKLEAAQPGGSGRWAN